MTVPVDRTARNRATSQLRALISGHITNDAFEDSEPKSNDPAIRAVWSSAWCLYSDMSCHSLTGRHAVHPREMREVMRWIVFLDSDLPYSWPSIACPGFADPRLASKRISLFGQRARARRFFAHGDHTVWPFARRRDHKRALGKPRRLNRRASRNDPKGTPQ